MMKDDVQHRKTRKIKRKRGKTRTLKVGGMQGEALRDKVNEFMANATGLLNQGQTFTPREYDNLKTAVEDALTHDRGDSRNPRALGSAAPRTARLEDRKKSAMNEIRKYLPQDKTTPESRSTLEQQVMTLMDADHARQLEVANATRAATEVEASDGTMVLPDQLARHEEKLRVKREQAEKAEADAKRKEEKEKAAAERRKANEEAAAKKKEEKMVAAAKKQQKKEEKTRETLQKNADKQVNSRMSNAIKEHVTDYIMDWEALNNRIQESGNAGIEYIKNSVVPSMPNVLSAYDFVTSSEPVTEQRYKEFTDANKNSRIASPKQWNEVKTELMMQVTGEPAQGMTNTVEERDALMAKYNPSAPPGPPQGGGTNQDSTVVTVLPSPLLREKSGAITDLVLNGTLAQLYPMDPFFRPNSAQCPVSILANNAVDPNMFAKGYGNKILQPGGALTALDFLNSSDSFTKRVSELSDNQSLCYNLFFQQTNVPKNVAYMLMCIANNGFDRPGPTTEPIVDVEKLQKFWNPVSLEWQYRDIKTGKILTLAEIETNNATRIRQGAKPGAIGLYDVRYIGTRNDCNLDAIVSMAAGAHAPILPVYCWTNGKSGFFDSQRFPDNIVACELFNQVQSRLGGEGKIFNDSIMNNIISILPAQYNNKSAFKEVNDVALSVPGLEVKMEEELGEAIREYGSSPAVKRTTITKQWQIDGRLFQRIKLVKAIILFNSKQGEYSTQMMSLNKVPFLVPVTPDATNLESVRSYYADFFANIPANALENPIMPVYGSVSYLNASSLGQQINSPGYGSGSSMMLWLMLALTLFPEHPNRLNELIQLDKLAPDETVNFSVTGLEEELDSPEVIRNFTVIVLQAICRELFSRAFEPSASEPTSSDTGAMMNEITEAMSLASDKRDASRSFYDKMTGSNKYTPEQAAKKREALVKMNQYLLGDNLRVCRNENAIAGESQKTDIGLKWVQPVTRTEQDNFIQEKPYFSIFNRQRTEAQKQSDLKKLEDRQDGFLGSGVACIFNNDAVSYPLSEYTIACGTKTKKCAPLTPKTNFAFVLANLQMAYIKMKFRATLLDKPDKQEFVNDLGNYGLRYIEKYFGNAASKGPEWLSKSGYKNAPPGGVVGTKVFDPKQSIWVPILKPSTRGSQGNSRLEVKIGADGKVDENIASEPSVADYQEAILYDYLKRRGADDQSGIFASLAATDSSDIYEELRTKLKRLAVLVRNITDTPEFKQKQNIAKDQANAQREKNIKELKSDGFKEASQADGEVMWIPPNVYAKAFNDKSLKNKRLTYDEAIKFLEPEKQDRIKVYRESQETGVLSKVVSKAQQPVLATRVEDIKASAKKLGDELKEASSIGEVNRIISQFNSLITNLTEGPDNEDGSKAKAMTRLQRGRATGRDELSGVEEYMEEEDKKTKPNKFYLDTLKPILKDVARAYKKQTDLEGKAIASDVTEAEAIVNKKPFDLDAFESKMAEWTSMIKEKEAYNQKKQETEFGVRATAQATNAYTDARSVLEKEFDAYGDGSVPANLEAQNDLLDKLDRLTEAFEGPGSANSKNKSLRDGYNTRYQDANKQIDEAAATLNKHRKDVAIGSDGKVDTDWQKHKEEVEKLMNDIKAYGDLPDTLKDKFAKVQEQYKTFSSQIQAGVKGQNAKAKAEEEKKKREAKEREDAAKIEKEKERAHDVAMKLAEQGKEVTKPPVPAAQPAPGAKADPKKSESSADSKQPGVASDGSAPTQVVGTGPNPKVMNGGSEIESLRMQVAELQRKIQSLEGGTSNSEEIERKLEEFNDLLNMTGGAVPIDEQVDDVVNDAKDTMSEPDYGKWKSSMGPIIAKIFGILELQYPDAPPDSDFAAEFSSLTGLLVAIWCYSRMLDKMQKLVKARLETKKDETAQDRNNSIGDWLDKSFPTSQIQQEYERQKKIVDDYNNKSTCVLSGVPGDLSIPIECLLDSTPPSPTTRSK
jgi:hypothetical protein